MKSSVGPVWEWRECDTLSRPLWDLARAGSREGTDLQSVTSAVDRHTAPEPPLPPETQLPMALLTHR